MTEIILIIVALAMLLCVLVFTYKIIDKVGHNESFEHTVSCGMFKDTVKINCNKADE